ncbi:hypothetical protein ACFVVX_12435 [Kitasatospora sp. NPDC058170]|uniref:hypothetical protein n=1 Tax=Kitasatospora sp. NPDC058170 TaxID=3346364 RepID=UPI0036DC1161
MLVESLAFVLIGLVTGLTALLALPAYFPAGRALTIGTAVVAALLGGVIAHFTLDGGYPAVTLAVSALCSALLTSVLARPDCAAGRAPAHRHRPHRAGAHRRHRPA